MLTAEGVCGPGPTVLARIELFAVLSRPWRARNTGYASPRTSPKKPSRTTSVNNATGATCKASATCAASATWASMGASKPQYL